MPEQHALLSASGSHKWLHCTPSARLEEKIPEQTSSYAEEGRLAHEIAELKMKKQFTDPMGPKTFKNRLKKLQENPIYQDEMLKHTDSYMDFVLSIMHSYNYIPYISIEKRIDYSRYAPEGFGTCDCIIIGGGTIHIIDFKYGKGVPVSAEMNPQMMLYALGAFTAYSFLYNIETVNMVIVQPRLDSISQYSMSINDLLAWGDKIQVTAQKAFNGEGEHAPGEWCRFCRAKALCTARTAFNLEIEEQYHRLDPRLMTNEEVGHILLGQKT